MVPGIIGGLPLPWFLGLGGMYEASVQPACIIVDVELLQATILGSGFVVSHTLPRRTLRSFHPVQPLP